MATSEIPRTSELGRLAGVTAGEVVDTGRLKA